MTDFVSTRCIRCGTPSSGQYCTTCSEQKRSEEAERAERVAKAIADRPAPQSTTGTLCPGCGMWASNDARFCDYCRFQFSALPGHLKQLVYARFRIQFVAWIIDTIILVVIGFVIGTVVTNISEASFLHFVAGAVYSIAFWVGTGATPGKMVMGIKVVMSNGDPIQVGPAVLRYVGYTLSALFFLFIGFIGILIIAFPAEILGLHGNIATAFFVFTWGLLIFSMSFWMIESSAQKKGPHDYIANTVVVKSR